MTLLIVVFAAIISTVVWYSSEKARELKVGILCYLYWGASLMWFVDAVAEYMELREEFFNPAVTDMINDSFLGFAAVAFALVIWVVLLLIKDPKNVVKAAISNKK